LPLGLAISHATVLLSTGRLHASSARITATGRPCAFGSCGGLKVTFIDGAWIVSILTGKDVQLPPEKGLQRSVLCVVQIYGPNEQAEKARSRSINGTSKLQLHLPLFFCKVYFVLESLLVIVRDPLVVRAPCQILHSGFLVVDLFEVESLDVGLDLRKGEDSALTLSTISKHIQDKKLFPLTSR
jgi:hypothetical protein